MPISSESEIRRIEITVNCRLVRDYQKTVNLVIHCHFPDFHIPNQEIRFTGRIGDRPSVDAAKDGPPIEFSSNSHDLLIRHLSMGVNVFGIMNDTRYFIYDKDSFTMSGVSAVVIKVRLNKDTVQQDAAILVKVRHLLLRPSS
jgi:hypothetical protein